jgi:hypothetical protein
MASAAVEHDADLPQWRRRISVEMAVNQRSAGTRRVETDDDA